MEKDFIYLQQFQQGKESGLRYFMSSLGKQIRFFAYSIVRNKEVAEEIVADSFYKLWKGRERIKSINNIKAFLYIATKNACYDYNGSSHQKIPFDYDLSDSLEEPTAGVMARIIYGELLDLIIKEVNKLPKLQAQVFTMSYLEGYSTEEICTILDTSSNTVYFARSKAISNLKLKFQDKKSILYFLTLCSLNFLNN